MKLSTMTQRMIFKPICHMKLPWQFPVPPCSITAWSSMLFGTRTKCLCSLSITLYRLWKLYVYWAGFAVRSNTVRYEGKRSTPDQLCVCCDSHILLTRNCNYSHRFGVFLLKWLLKAEYLSALWYTSFSAVSQHLQHPIANHRCNS